MLKKIITGNGIQICHIADNLMVVGMDPESSISDCFLETEPRIVFPALPFRDHHCPLGFHFLQVIGAVEHPVSFQLQRQVDFVGRHGLKIGCPIQISESVPQPASP